MNTKVKQDTMRSMHIRGIALVLATAASAAIVAQGCDSSTAPVDLASSASPARLVDVQAVNLPNDELARLRAATARYHDIDSAIADGYDFEFTGYRTQMGFHYMKPELVDATFEVERPEVLMYAPGPGGKLRFVGVEYATPIADMQNPPPPPEGFSGEEDVWSINTEFEVWTLHAWVGLENPDGIFTAHNPRLP